MRRILAVAILAGCAGCRSSNFWRPKPDNLAKRSADYAQAESGFFPPGVDKGGLGLTRDPNAGGLPVIR
jgi:hypothetical protein